MSPHPARPYILAGAGFAKWKYINRYYKGVPDYSKCFAYNVGVGYDIRLSQNFAMQIEATAFSSVGDDTGSLLKDFDHSNKFLFMGRIGCTYTF